MIKLIIFSKNRALQLQALLRSNKKRCDIFHCIEVIYKADDYYKESYEKLKQQWNNIIFTKERNFEKDTKKSINSDYFHTCFMVDDDMFYRNVIPDVNWYIEENDCYSLRLGENIKVKSHFKYPLSLDGHIFNTKTIRVFINKINFNNPNRLESRLQKFKKRIKKIHYAKSGCLIGVPVNRVSDSSRCTAGEKHNYTEKYLDDMFKQGYEIDFENIDFSGIRNVHKEVELKFKKV